MHASAITLDEATAAKLTASNGHPVPLCAAGGEVIGYYLSPARFAETEREHRALSAGFAGSWQPDEIRKLEEARKLDPRPNIPHDEVLRWIEGQ